jgi:hypothetical protein
VFEVREPPVLTTPGGSSGSEDRRRSFETAVSSLLPRFIIDMFGSNGEAAWSDVEPLARGE